MAKWFHGPTILGGTFWRRLDNAMETYQERNNARHSRRLCLFHGRDVAGQISAVLVGGT